MAEEKHHRFFQNRACKYFPCHKGIAEEAFNCLFCFCPLYMLGKKCGGNCRYNEKGDKDCADCAFPHHRDHYEKIIARYSEIKAAMGKLDGEE